MKNRTLLLLLALLIKVTPLHAGDALPKGLRVYAPGPAPAFRLADMDGESFALSEASGHWVFVHFWASWCGPCREEMPAVQRMAEQLQDERLVIVMVNTSEDEDTIFIFLGSYAPDMNSLMDSDGQVTEAWQPRGLPATIWSTQRAIYATKRWEAAPGMRENTSNFYAHCPARPNQMAFNPGRSS